ncbi:hypothetical protein Gasu2_34090 [Galdieria sulphuraria]|uniref:Uncharacterized protein n=1 Tax=Galdieria sulphuraria TaxID=130081 RepID=M2X7G3_GALSU|nr:uncharacterized protein Gasu_65790 [Galdieria sulphuraria]EME25762.1 hypothetical protein Gasu_65790 [Galdieria sulphuraria]GJD09139.1 hypothetical protein Gasu2_34090 [Galdieria sulphuraria]|eukprot:XP_005702282.1 hypothetical protein Gasu_65790 [Galdieria sulphuraria]
MTMTVDEVDFSQISFGEENKLNTYGTIVPVKYAGKSFSVCLGDADVKVMRNKFNEAKINLIVNNLSSGSCDFLEKLDSFMEKSEVVVSHKRCVYSVCKRDDAPLFAEITSMTNICNVADDKRLSLEALNSYGGWLSAIPVVNFSCLMVIGNKISLKKRVSALLITKLVKNEYSDSFVESLKSKYQEENPEGIEELKDQINKQFVDTLDFDEQ